MQSGKTAQEGYKVIVNALVNPVHTEPKWLGLPDKPILFGEQKKEAATCRPDFRY